MKKRTVDLNTVTDVVNKAIIFMLIENTINKFASFSAIDKTKTTSMIVKSINNATV